MYVRVVHLCTALLTIGDSFDYHHLLTIIFFAQYCDSSDGPIAFTCISRCSTRSLSAMSIPARLPWNPNPGEMKNRDGRREIKRYISKYVLKEEGERGE